MRSDYENIKEYLLGGLDAQERESIELRIIEDEEFSVEALAAEDELIESYVDGDLNGNDEGRFRSDYLTTEERVRRVKEFAALRAAIAREHSQARETTEKSRSGFLGFLNRMRPIPALTAAAVLLIAVAGLWFFLSNRGPTGLEKEYAALNQSDMTDLSRFASHSAVELRSSTLRSGDAGSKVATGSLTETVLFRLPLTFDPEPSARFDVVLLQEGKSKFTVPGVGPVTNGDGSEVRVLLPREVIKTGQYQISLTRPETTFSPVLFTFTAE